MRNSAKNFDVLSPHEFLEDIELEARSAKKRIYAQAMEVEPGEVSSRLLAIVEKAAESGLDARLNVDYYSLMVTDGLPNLFPFTISEKWRKRLRIRNEAFQQIKDKGGRIAFVNKPTLLEKFIYTMGRNHMKIFIIDDIAWIGGVNFADGYFKRQDIMVKITDKAIVAPIARVFIEVHNEQLTYDEILKTKHNASLFIDTGHTGQSVILDAAVAMIHSAKHSIKVASAFVPDGKFLKALIDASKQGVFVELATSAPEKTFGVYRLVNEMSRFSLNLRGVSFNVSYAQKPVHAKVLIIDNALALFGSHNFLTKGVLMHTAEIALQSSDKTLVANLLQFYKSFTK